MVKSFPSKWDQEVGVTIVISDKIDQTKMNLYTLLFFYFKKDTMRPTTYKKKHLIGRLSLMVNSDVEVKAE